MVEHVEQAPAMMPDIETIRGLVSHPPRPRRVKAILAAQPILDARTDLAAIIDDARWGWISEALRDEMRNTLGGETLNETTGQGVLSIADASDSTPDVVSHIHRSETDQKAVDDKRTRGFYQLKNPSSCRAARHRGVELQSSGGAHKRCRLPPSCGDAQPDGEEHRACRGRHSEPPFAARGERSWVQPLADQLAGRR